MTISARLFADVESECTDRGLYVGVRVIWVASTALSFFPFLSFLLRDHIDTGVIYSITLTSICSSFFYLSFLYFFSLNAHVYLPFEMQFVKTTN